MTPARLTPTDWAWSLGLHGGLVLVALVWSASTPPAPAFKPLQVNLAWQAKAVPPPLPAVEPVPVEPPKPTARPVTKSVVPPKKVERAQPQPASPQLAPRVVPEVAPVLASAPAVVLPVAASETLAPKGSAPEVTTAPQVAKQAAASLGSATPAAVAHTEAAHQRWRDQLMHALHQHKTYPPSARRMGQTGTVHVRVRVSATGELLSAELVESSGFKALDGAAELLVRTVLVSLASQLQPGRATELRIPVVYELKES